MVDESSTGTVGLLIAVVQKQGHSRFDIEDHLAKHTISPAEPKSVVSLWVYITRKANRKLTMTESRLSRYVTQRSRV